MPRTKVVFFKDDNGTAPVVDWLASIKCANPDAFKNCTAVIEDLEEFGHELRRPTADFLRDGIRELRTKHQHVQYRILYFFNGKDFAVLAHAIIKKASAVPDVDIDRAIKRKMKFESDPKRYTWEEDENAED
ncbi:MAG TPA: type II toxin-antitoxin system RelE/ParE family toxin [Planctomycetota bacterium]|nr:type II toxin-antitoxin system RelE/ParE family toxin [Planctomycetota bacterium]